MSIVTVFGGSGFIGRYVVVKLAKRGHRVRVAVRRPNEALHLRLAGDVGQVEPIQVNIRDEASTQRAIEGSDAVVNLVGILYPTGRQSFDAVQHEGAERIARLCASQGITNLVHISAIGADIDSDIPYAHSKGEGEAAILKHVPTATILRPSVVFGQEDQFFNRFGSMASVLPFLPLIKGETKYQPAYVGDVAEAIARAVDGKAGSGKIYELGGPEIVSMKDLMETVIAETGRKRFLIPIPNFIARMKAWFFEIPNRLFGVAPILTRAQLDLMEHDNVVSEGAAGFAELGIEPTSMGAILPSYLYRYRPYGQYARNMPQHRDNDIRAIEG